MGEDGLSQQQAFVNLLSKAIPRMDPTQDSLGDSNVRNNSISSFLAVS